MRKGWYILVGATAVLIVLLLGVAAYNIYEGHRGVCAPGATTCILPSATP